MAQATMMKTVHPIAAVKETNLKLTFTWGEDRVYFTQHYPKAICLGNRFAKLLIPPVTILLADWIIFTT
jgi:hypothetical protein